MRLTQFQTVDGNRSVAVSDSEPDYLRVVDGCSRIYDMAVEAISEGKTLESLVLQRIGKQRVSYHELMQEGRILPPIDHPDSAHCLVTGTGLSHLGSAQARNEMHTKLANADEILTDSMKMFKLGLDGGKPASGSIGVQPEWFWKGNGSIVCGSGQTLTKPAFAEDGGEEAELAGIYVIGNDNQPYRLGFSLANEFSDHVVEKKNYLYLAHSKLRVCSLGPELRLGPLPDSIVGEIRVRRDNQIIWRSEMLSGEENMSHSIGNLEHHHFKYELFRQPGDVHVHFFGAGALSFANGIQIQDGDWFEIEAEEFGRPLQNQMQSDRNSGLVTINTI